MLRRHLKEHLFANSMGIHCDVAMHEVSAWAVKSKRETVKGTCSLHLPLRQFPNPAVASGPFFSRTLSLWNYTSG